MGTSCRTAWSAGVWQVPAEWLNELGDRGRPPRAARVRLDWRRVLQQWLGDLPQPVDAVRAGEQGLVADHRVEDQPLVALQRVRRGERVGVFEDHLFAAERHLSSRLLGQELRGDRAGIGEVDDDLVPAPVRDVLAMRLEHPQGRLVEGERDYLPAGPEALAGPQI